MKRSFYSFLLIICLLAQLWVPASADSDMHVSEKGLAFIQELNGNTNHLGAAEAAVNDFMDTYRLNQYCRPVDPDFVRAVNAKKPKTMEDLADVWYVANKANYYRNEHYNDSRYHMLNLHATFTKGTVEFRLFQFNTPDGQHRSGLHAGALKSYIQLCLAMSAKAKAAKSISPNKVQMDNQKYAMAGWLCNMGLTGPEFKTARTIFTNNLTLFS